MFTDIVGKEVNVGDTVALATRVGNSAELRVREIIDFKTEGRMNFHLARVRNPYTGRTAWVNAQSVVLLERTKE
jgi:hypothetical protein